MRMPPAGISDSDASEIESVLAAAKLAVNETGELAGSGFWRAVGWVRRRPDLAERFGDLIGEIDRQHFESRVRWRVPAQLGVLALGAGTAGGVAAVALASKFADPYRTAAFLAGFALLEVAPHSLTHWIVGRALGIRFTHFFMGGPPPPRPGAKVDYGSYLRASPKRRAVMHASGAIVTKVIPFALLPAAASLDLGGWVFVVLWTVGIGQIFTDLLLSTKSSDWKKVRREWRAARAA